MPDTCAIEIDVLAERGELLHTWVQNYTIVHHPKHTLGNRESC